MTEMDDEAQHKFYMRELLAFDDNRVLAKARLNKMGPNVLFEIGMIIDRLGKEYFDEGYIEGALLVQNWGRGNDYY